MPDSSFNRIGGEQRVLLVSSDAGLRNQVQSILEAQGFRVELLSRLNDVPPRLALLRPDVVLLDLDSASGPDAADAYQGLLRAIQSSPAQAPVLVLSDPAGFPAALEMLRKGAADFLVKPFLADDLLRRLRVAYLAAHNPVLAARLRSSSEAAFPRPGSGTGIQPGEASSVRGPRVPPDLILGQSAATRHVIDQVTLVAPKNTTVLITGETGTGKERIARAIHALSLRYRREMVSVNCGGIPATLLEDEFFGHVKGAFTDAHQQRLGRFEQAHGSSIFLDEIGDLPLELQPKLLRVLQEREIHRIGGVETVRVDVRVIAATNVDLWSRVADASFREDLFYRINVFPIHLPPLRERREDIPLLAERFLQRFCLRDNLSAKRFDPSAEAELMARPWLGNIRELENAVEIAVIRSQDRQQIEVRDLPERRDSFRGGARGGLLEVDSGEGFKGLVGRFERDLIARVLERTSGNKTQAADLLGLKRTTLIEKLKKMEPPVHVDESG